MQLRDYQQTAHDLLWLDLCTQAGNPLVVAPTGSGKSPLIGAICQTAIERYNARIIVLAHRQELLNQNSEKIRAFLPPDVSVGIYSAGLRRSQTDETVICAGIQSVAKKATLFGSRQLVIIDEAHLVPNDGDGQYRKFLNDLQEINPRLRIVGLTATPFRTGAGEIIGPEKIFHRIAHEVPVKQLIDAGWLCPLISQPGDASIDTSGVHVIRGEFVNSELERLFDGKIIEACKEIVTKTTDRHSVLVFCQNVSHAERVQACLERLTGQDIGLVTGTTNSIERQANLQGFRSQRIRYLVNVDVLTTGFDAPCIDAIAVLRATMSPGLFAQIVGRGLRLDKSKADCLVLDFGENVIRHGQLDDPKYGRKPKKKKRQDGDEDETEDTEETETKERFCTNCSNPIEPGIKECPECGFEMPEVLVIKHDGKASNKSLLGHKVEPEKTQPEWFIVDQVDYAEHQKRGSELKTLRVDYICHREQGNITEKISEWVCFDHDGFARSKANLWWLARSHYAAAETVQEALEAGQSGELKEPVRIKAHREGRFWKVDAFELVEAKPRLRPEFEEFTF